MRRLRGDVLTVIALCFLPLSAASGQAGFDLTDETRVGDWMVTKSVDRFNDDNMSIAGTMSGPENPIEGSGGLVFVCIGDNALATLETEYLGLYDDYESKRVRWIVDDGRVRTGRWEVVDSGVGGTTLRLRGSEAHSMADVLRKGRQMHVLVYDHRDRRQSYSFSLMGLTDALERLPCSFGHD